MIDQNNDGVLDYSEFMRNFIGTMSEYRKLWVRRVSSGVMVRSEVRVSSDAW